MTRCYLKSIFCFVSHFFVIAFEIRQGLVVSCYQNNLFVTFIVLKKKKEKKNS